MANEFIARKGIISRADSQITGSLNVSTTVTASGFSGDGSQLTNITAVSSSYSTTASYVEGNIEFPDGLLVTGSITASGAISSSGGFIGDGSQLTNITTVSSSYAQTASLLLGSVVSASYADTASYIDGYINFPNGLNVTGSLNLSGSMSASGAITASAFVGDGTNVTGVVSSSYSTTASYALNGGAPGGSGIFAQTGSVYATTNDLEISGSLVISGSALEITDGSFILSSSNGDTLKLSNFNSNWYFDASGAFYVFQTNETPRVTISGTGVSPWANDTSDLGSTSNYWRKLYVTNISASGDVSASTFTGDGSQITGVVTSSYSNTASYVETAQTASYVQIAQSAQTASYLEGILNFPAGLIVTGSITASQTITASAFYGDGANITGVVSSSYAQTASYVETAQTASYVLNAISSSYASTSSYAETAQTASYVLNAVSSSYSSTASYVETAQTASYIDGLISFPNGLDVTGSLLVDGDISSSGIITASAFYGDGSNITGVVSSSYALTATTASYINGVIEFSNGLDVTGSVLISGPISASGQATFGDIDSAEISAIGQITTTSHITASGNISSSGDVIASAFNGDGSNITGVVSSSYALTSSHTPYAIYAETASYSEGSIEFPSGLEVTGSFLLDGSMSASGDVTASAFIGDGAQITGVVSSSYSTTASYVETAQTASYVLNAVSSSYSTTASYVDGYIEFANGLVVTGSITASQNITASAFYGDGTNVTGVVSSSYAQTASLLLGSVVSASYALTSSFATSASWAPGGGGAVSTYTNGTDNYVITATGADGINGEQNLTFDGSKSSLNIFANDAVSKHLIFYSGSGAASAATASLYFDNNKNFLISGTGGPFNSTLILQSGTTDVRFASNALTPGQDIQVNLGSTTRWWKNAFISDISASGDVSASTFTGDGSNITGVVSSSYANTASYVETAQTASYFIGDISFPSGLEVTGSLLLDGSMSASGDVTASAFIGDGSQITGVVSSSYALTSSFATSASWSPAVVSTYTNGTDNYVITSTGADGINAEQNLRFDGSSMEVTGSLDVTGAFTAQTKSFLIDHQMLPGKKLIYGVLEGPEHSVFVRGKLNGQYIIELPEEWSWLIDPESITVQITPYGTHQRIYVHSISDNTVYLNSPDGVPYCYYLIHATRKDVDPLQTVQ